MNNARPSSSLLASSSAARWPSRKMSRYRAYVLEQPRFRSRGEWRAPTTQKRSTSALRQFSSWNGARHTSIPETRWPIRCGDLIHVLQRRVVSGHCPLRSRPHGRPGRISTSLNHCRLQYGVPTLASKTRRSSPAETFDSIVLARWENAESLLTLPRGSTRLNFG